MGSYIRDAMALVGLACTGYGVWMVYPPASLITVGALLMAAAVVPYLRGGR